MKKYLVKVDDDESGKLAEAFISGMNAILLNDYRNPIKVLSETIKPGFLTIESELTPIVILSENGFEVKEA